MFAYVDCAQDTTETQAVQTIAADVNDPEFTGVRVPDKDLSTSTYYERLWRVLDVLYVKEHALLDIVERSKHGGGSAEGSYTKHQLLGVPTVAKEVLSEETQSS